MSRKRLKALIAVEQIERQIYIIRGQRVMLDVDLAALYGVPTFRLNEQVKRNRSRFPSDFAFQIAPQELRALTSQIAMPKNGRGGRRTMPWAFTEHGVAMLSSVLRSPFAVKVNIEIMRAFVRLRRLLATPGEFAAQILKLAETVQLHDHQIQVITDILKAMMEPPTRSTKGRFGFHMPEKSTASGSPQE